MLLGVTYSPDVAIAVTFACKVVFSGGCFRFLFPGEGVSIKMISMLFIFLLGGIPGWILMVKE